jgi:hypothetical protein
MRLENEKFSDIDSIGVRIPTELKAKIKQAAKENKQSMNAEIVRRLESSFTENMNDFNNYELFNEPGMTVLEVAKHLIDMDKNYRSVINRLDELGIKHD